MSARRDTPNDSGRIEPGDLVLVVRGHSCVARALLYREIASDGSYRIVRFASAVAAQNFADEHNLEYFGVNWFEQEEFQNSGGECVGCGRIMSVRERLEQGVCDDCATGRH